MIYLDNAATTFPKPDIVTARVTEALGQCMGTPGRGAHGAALRAGDNIAEVRESIAKFFGVLENYRVIFTYSATDALNMALKGFLSAGDKVVISAVEHNSVLRPLKGLEESIGIQLHIAPCDEKGYILLPEFEKILGDDTKLAVICHSSNVTGAVNDIDEVVRIVRKSGAYLLLDAAQTAGSVKLDIRETDADFVAFSGHKSLYGLQGTGCLIIGRRVTKLKYYREGGTGFDSQSERQPVAWPEAFEAGTHNVPGIISMGAGLEFINSTGMNSITAHTHGLIASLWEDLSKVANITLYSPTPDEARTSVLSFTVDGWEAGDIGNVLDKNYGIRVRCGLHCSALAHKHIGTFPHGTVRVSPGYFNTYDDINRFVKAVKTVASLNSAWY